MASKVIRQRVSAGNDLDGTAPVGPPETQDAVKTIYPIETAGGEFSPGVCTLRQVTIETFGQDWWRAKIVHGDLSETLLGDGHDFEEMHILDVNIALAADDKVVALTHDAKGPITCNVVFDG